MKGVAIHSAPKPYIGALEVTVKRPQGESVGQPLSRESDLARDADAVTAEGLRTLRPAWALADLLHRAGWERCGLSPDDFEWSQPARAERDWRAARKAVGLAPVALRDMGVSARAHQPRVPVVRQHRPLRRLNDRTSAGNVSSPDLGRRNAPWRGWFEGASAPQVVDV